MNQGLIPRRYAKALFEFALEQQSDKSIYMLMKCLLSSFESEPSLSEVLSNPYINGTDKISLLVTAAGASSSDVVFADFLKLLKQNNRLDLARQIALAYIDIYRKANDIYQVDVTSAAPLSAEEEARIKSLVASHLNGGVLEFNTAVDSSLIGGFTITVGNERVDASIKNELKQLRLNLLRNYNGSCWIWAPKGEEQY